MRVGFLKGPSSIESICDSFILPATELSVRLQATGAPAEKPSQLPSCLPYDIMECSVIEPRTPSSEAAYNPLTYVISCSYHLYDYE
jgi:hypothetical protein